MKLPPKNEYGTYIRRLTKQEWAWIKAEAERKMKDANSFWEWGHCHNQIHECEKHL